MNVRRLVLAAVLATAVFGMYSARLHAQKPVAQPAPHGIPPTGCPPICNQ